MFYADFSTKLRRFSFNLKEDASKTDSFNDFDMIVKFEKFYRDMGRMLCIRDPIPKLSVVYCNMLVVYKQFQILKSCDNVNRRFEVWIILRFSDFLAVVYLMQTTQVFSSHGWHMSTLESMGSASFESPKAMPKYKFNFQIIRK